MANSNTLIQYILEYLLIPLGQISILLFGFMGIFLAIKYRTLSFSSKATKIEIVLFKTGGFGFLIIGAISIILAIFSN